MSFRVVADENVPHSVVHRLDHYGHDIVHIDFVSDLGKGSSDQEIAQYSRQTGRLILSNDDDFLVDFEFSEYHGLLFIEDETLADKAIADIVHEISTTISGDQIESVGYVSSTWL